MIILILLFVLLICLWFSLHSSYKRYKKESEKEMELWLENETNKPPFTFNEIYKKGKD